MVKVLIVDDTVAAVKLLACVLEGQGYDVCAAYSGREALHVAAAEHPDVLLMDVMMHGMNGIATCRRLKADAELRMIPVLLVTAMGRDEDVIAGLDAGAEDYITKPFNNSVLLARLRAAVRVKQSHDEIARKNEELRQAQKLEAVGRLAGGIAHEFNNLLQAIGGYASCAMEGLSPEDRRDGDLRQVLKATDRAAALTQQLLGFSRRRTLQPENVDPNQVVSDLAKMLRPIIGEQISLEVALGADVGTVHADPGEIQQVLLNLCLNARDAMPAGGKLLVKTGAVMLSEAHWDARFQITPGRHVIFTVTDTGQGMSAEVRERIFEPFFTTKEVGKGTGLGLATVYGIVQQHNGAIHVYTEPGNGTTFKIYLPSAANPAEDEPAEEPAHVPGGSETILLAEDDPVVRRLGVRFLTDRGYTVLSAPDGEDAVRMFRENRSAISLVILDAIMPKLTGHEVYRQIKAECPEARIMFCTGYDPENARSKFIFQENLRLLEKPFDADTLLRTVRQVLDEEAECQLLMQT